MFTPSLTRRLNSSIQSSTTWSDDDERAYRIAKARKAELDRQRLGTIAPPVVIEAGQALSWRDWNARYFKPQFGYGQRHVRLWEWAELLAPGIKPRPRVEPWPRGGAKSSTGERITARVGVKLSRRFVLFVSETQPQADRRVQNVAALFEKLGVGRALNRYGASKGWTHDELRTENGFNVASLGLDAAGRGIKLDDFRPDFIIFDDIDSRHDTEATRAKKIETITTSILPAGSFDCAVLFLQNPITKDSIVSQLIDGRADFLHDREVATAEPAVIGLQVEQVKQEDGTLRFKVVGGIPTWEGQDLATCEGQINTWGLRAFRRESQHELDDEDGGLWQRQIINDTRVTSPPPLHRICVGVDPNATEGGDEAGVIVAGIAKIDGKLHGYILEDATTDGGPKRWADAAVQAYRAHGGDVMVAESNNGGEMVKITIQTVPGAPSVKLVHASTGKLTRAEPVQKLYEDGLVHHVGHGFAALESEMCTYKPERGMASPGRLDAAVWAITELMLAPKPGRMYSF